MKMLPKNTTIRVFLLALLWVPTRSQTCPICEDGSSMGNPNGIVSTATGASAQCSALEQHAMNLTGGACKSLQALALVPCECPGFNITATEVPTESDGVVDTFRTESFVCSICGDGEMTNPSGMALNTVGRPTSCQTLYDNQERISQGKCGYVQSFARIPCGCSSTTFLDETNTTNVTETNATFTCNICGDGRVGNPNGVVENNRGQQRSCAALDATSANLTESACATIQEMAREPCECTAPGFDDATTNDELPFLCSVCGDGGVMTMPQATVSTPAGQTVRCGALEANANTIPQSSCSNVQSLVREPCGCVFSGVDDQQSSNSTTIDNANVDTTAYQCPICDGGEMTILTGIVTSRNGNSARCDVLLANSATIPESACSNVQALAQEPCGCVLPIDTNTSMASGIENVTECSICGLGEMTNPSGIVTTPQGQTARCSSLAANAHTIVGAAYTLSSA